MGDDCLFIPWVGAAQSYLKWQMGVCRPALGLGGAVISVGRGFLLQEREEEGGMREQTCFSLMSIRRKANLHM